jgi:4-amino-4-deoxy-L-arabinose transferase-like glycosyltransferase
MDVSRAVEQRFQRTRGVTRHAGKLGLMLTAAVPTLAYLLTMPPTVYGLDSAELTVGAYTLGLVHPPGYPLYLLLGKLFTWLPVGDVGFRTNLMSAAFGVLTLMFVYSIARRLTRDTVVALAAALFLGFSWYFWTDAIVAEVYTLQSAVSAGLLWLLLVWRATRNAKWLYAFALVAGLGFANYPATALLAPGLLAFIWLTDRRALLDGRRFVVVSAIFAVGCLVYAYLPVRYLARPAFNYMGTYDAAGIFRPTDLTSLSELWYVATGGPFHGLAFAYTAPELLGQIAQYTYFLWGNFLGVGLPLGVLGLIHGWQRDRTVAIASGLMYTIYAAFFISYRVVDKHTMFLPSYVIWALWIAWGYSAVLEWASVKWQPAVRAGGLVVAAGALIVNFSLADVSWDRRAHDNAAAMLKAAEQNALVLADWGYAAPMSYLQLVESRRPDVEVVNNFLISYADAQELVARSIERRPVYIVSVEPDRSAAARYELQVAGPGFRVLEIK